MRVIVRIKQRDYKPGIEDKIKAGVESATGEPVSIRTVVKN